MMVFKRKCFGEGAELEVLQVLLAPWSEIVATVTPLQLPG